MDNLALGFVALATAGRKKKPKNELRYTLTMTQKLMSFPGTGGQAPTCGFRRPTISA